MSTFNVFDTHPMFKRLTNAGLTPPAAETLVEEFAHLLKSQSHTDRMNLLTENFQLRTELAQWKRISSNGKPSRCWRSSPSPLS